MRSELYEWRPVAGYEGLYEVNNLGEVRRVTNKVMMKNGVMKTVRERILKPGLCGKGYQFVGLCKENNVQREYIHRLVAQAFLPNPYNLPQINHKDEDKTNNRVDNLEWCTPYYNLTYNNRHLKVGQKNAGRWHPERGKRVNQYSINGEYITTYASVMECARTIGCSDSSIRRVIYGMSNTCNGYVFQYEDGSGRMSEEDIRRRKDRLNENKRNKYIPKKDRVLI